MLKIEKTVLPSPEQWEIIIEGMRNPMNSWDKMDSAYDDYEVYRVGKEDHKLMVSLAKGGPVHAKYRRMIPVYLTINAPLYWWKEFDTYKVGTVCNSCSTMHKIHAQAFTPDDFSHEHLTPWSRSALERVVDMLNNYRADYSLAGMKGDWWQMIQLLPTSYNQKRTVMLNYEVLHNIYYSRKNHKLDEWKVFCEWIESLPYSDLIVTEVKAHAVP